MYKFINQYSKKQLFTKEIVLLTYLREFIKPFELCLSYSLSEGQLLSLSLTNSTTNHSCSKPNVMNENKSDLIYNIMPVHFVGCVHITSQKPTETTATRDPKHRKLFDYCSRFTNTVICTNINSLRCNVRVSFKINPVISGSNQQSRPKVSIKHNI